MYLFFGIPLVIGIAASYFTKHSSDEISYLMGSLTFFSLILSLILAPWEIKMIVLAILVVSTHKFWRQVGGDLERETVRSSLKKSQLGEDFKQLKIESKHDDDLSQIHQPTTVPLPEELTGTYRGKPCHITGSHQYFQPHRENQLKYRGVNVNNHPTQVTQDSNAKKAKS